MANNEKEKDDAEDVRHVRHGDRIEKRAKRMTGTCINSRDISFRVVTEVERKLNEVGGVYFFFF